MDIGQCPFRAQNTPQKCMYPKNKQNLKIKSTHYDYDYTHDKRTHKKNAKKN